MTINEIQDQIIDEFSMLDNWEDRYEYIMDLGKKLPPMHDGFKTEQNIIKGCQSQVWIHPELKEGKVVLEGDSDASIVKGLLALVLRTLSGQPAAEVAKADLYFPSRIGMDRHLAQTRSNGLSAMIRQVKLYGLAYGALEAQKEAQSANQSEAKK
jgi:cysteine desulfuration protein SufE